MSASHSSSHSESAEHIKKHNKIYWAIFFALLIGTIVTVLLNSVHFDSMALTVGIALFVAIVKATLVAGFFMHLISEKKAIYIVLASTAFFLTGLMVLIIWSHSSMPSGMEYSATHYVPNPMYAPAK